MGITITGGLTFGNGLTVSSPPPITNYFFGKVSASSAVFQASGIALDPTNDNLYLTGGTLSELNSGSPFISIGSIGTVNVQNKAVIDYDYNTQYNTQMCTDSNGDVYTVGTAIYFGSTVLMIYKYTSTGTLTWARTLQIDGTPAGSPSPAMAPKISIDTSGVYVSTNMDIFSGGSRTVVMAFYKSTGLYKWISQLEGGAETLTVTGIYASGTGAVWAVGYSFSTGKLFLAGFDSADGVLSLQYSITGSSTLLNPSITSGGSGIQIAAVDTSGKAYLISYGFFGSATVRENSVSPSLSSSNYITFDGSGNYYMMFKDSGSNGGKFIILKYNTSLTLQWSRTFSSPTPTQEPTGIIVDTTGAKTAYAISGYMGSGSGYEAGGIFARLPVDGSGTGSQTVGDTTLSYESLSNTDSSTSFTVDTTSYTTTTPTVYNNENTINTTTSTTTLTISDYNF